MAKILFASKTIEYEGPYGTGSRKYEIRLSDIEAISVGTREKKALFGLIKKQERYLKSPQRASWALMLPSFSQSLTKAGMNTT